MTEYITKERAQDLIVTAAQGNSSRLACMLSKLEDEPPADVAPVRHGRWRIIKEAPIARKFIPFNELTELDLQNECRCSRCGFNCSIGVGQSHLANYCPNCGARMDGGENND